VFVVFLSVFRQLLRYLKIGHDRFLTHTFQFYIHNHPTHLTLRNQSTNEEDQPGECGVSYWNYEVVSRCALPVILCVDNRNELLCHGYCVEKVMRTTSLSATSDFRGATQFHSQAAARVYRNCLHFKMPFAPQLISVTVIGSIPAIRIGYREINISLIKNSATSSFPCFRDLTFHSLGEFRTVTNFWRLSSKDSILISGFFLPRAVWPFIRFVLINFLPLKWQNWVYGFTTFYVSVFAHPRFNFWTS